MEEQPQVEPDVPPFGRALLVYSLGRFGLFLLGFVLLVALGVREPLLALGLAVLLSALLSIVVLRPQREALARATQARTRERLEQRAEMRRRLDES